MELIKITENGTEIVYCNNEDQTIIIQQALEVYDNARKEFEKIKRHLKNDKSEETQKKLLEAENYVENLRQAHINIVESDNASKKRYKELIDQGFAQFTRLDPPVKIEEGKTIKDSYKTIEGKIVQSWEVKEDPKHYEKQIDELKKNLSSSDFKVIKCYEANLVGEEMPYNITELSSERAFMRSEINRLRGFLENL